MLDKQLIIYEMFFNEEKNTIEIAEELNVTKQYVSKILTTKYKDEYEKEQLRRSENRAKKRNQKKGEIIREKRGTVDGEELRLEHEAAVRMMSKGGKMTNEASVFRNLNAYDVRGNKMVYNDRCGVRPNDLLRSFSLKYSIYR